MVSWSSCPGASSTNDIETECHILFVFDPTNTTSIHASVVLAEVFVINVGLGVSVFCLRAMSPCLAMR